jgi:hypothetical protein
VDDQHSKPSRYTPDLPIDPVSVTDIEQSAIVRIGFGKSATHG